MWSTGYNIILPIRIGMTEIFKELGVDYLIEGGQTMNPSTEDMLNAIARVNAKTIYIFPPEWAGTFGQPITSVAQIGILQQEPFK